MSIHLTGQGRLGKQLQDGLKHGCGSVMSLEVHSSIWCYKYAVTKCWPFQKIKMGHRMILICSALIVKFMAVAGQNCNNTSAIICVAVLKFNTLPVWPSSYVKLCYIFKMQLTTSCMI